MAAHRHLDPRSVAETCEVLVLGAGPAGLADKLGAAATYARVQELDAAKGLVRLDPSRANNTDAPAMRGADAEARGVVSISNLAVRKADANLKLGSNAEFDARSDGLKPIEATYGLEFGRESTARIVAARRPE